MIDADQFVDSLAHGAAKKISVTPRAGTPWFVLYKRLRRQYFSQMQGWDDWLPLGDKDACKTAVRALIAIKEQYE